MARRRAKQTKNAGTTAKEKKSATKSEKTDLNAKETEAEAKLRRDKEAVGRRLAEIYARYEGVNKTLRNLYPDRKLIDQEQLEFLKKEQRSAFTQIINRLTDPTSKSVASAKDAFLKKFNIPESKEKKE